MNSTDKIEPNFTIRKIATLLAGILGLFYTIAFIKYSNGNVINHYPHITPDGYDWYVEGMFLTAILSSSSLPDLNVLRPPTFVLITAIDYLFGGSGVVIGIVYGVVFIGTYLLVIRISDEISAESDKQSLFPIFALLLLSFHSINYVKKYLLSDSIAVALSLFSVYLLIRYIKTENLKIGLATVFVTTIAGLTQTYALLPYIIFSFWMAFQTLTLRSFKVNLIILPTLTVIIFLIITICWRYSIPHTMTPTNFGYLQFNFNMLPFYINTWGIYFITIIPVLLLYSTKSNRQKNKNELTIPTLLTIIILASLCLIYQWPESRFTYAFWPWILIFFSCTLNYTPSRARITTLVATVLLVLACNPKSYWVPEFNQISLNPSQNWLISYFRGHSIDRELTECGDIDCSNNNFFSHSDNYVKSSIKMYQLLTNR